MDISKQAVLRRTDSPGRRKFITDALKVTLASAFTLSFADASARVYKPLARTYTVADVMDIVVKAIPHAPFPQTVDTLKSGNKDNVVTGIVTTMFATVDIIHRAIELKANFIIAHEPTFFNHADNMKWVSPDAVADEKLALLENKRITVWRLHDYLHSFVPDSVTYAVVRAAGWLPYYKSGDRVIEIPAIRLDDLAKHLKSKLDIEQLRVIGNASHSCKSIALLPGASGGETHVAMVEKMKPDVLVVGEVREWETAEYIRDGLALGHKTALIVLGHIASEEPGLQWLQEWLSSKLEGIKVQHIPSGSPFRWI